MIHQVGRGGGPGLVCEIAWRTDHNMSRIWTKRHRDHVLRNRFCQTHPGVEPIRDDVDQPPFGHDFDLHPVIAAKIRPSVYQGLYNAITRAVEPELFKCLGNYGIRFHAYNPLAGGAFSRNFADSAAVAAGSRFDSSTAQCKLYRARYMNGAYLNASAEIHRSCEGHGLDAIYVALRWLIHHSQLNAERNDGIIIGASSLEHLRHNLSAVTEGPLPTEVLAAIDDAALKAQPKWPPYFSGV